MSNARYDCIILGGGAAGLFAASMLVKLTKGNSKILVIDGNDRCGKKLAMTGSGRCNLSNKEASAGKYHTDCPELLDACLKAFGSDDAIDFFENELGIVTVCDNGLYYPSTYRAQTVIDSFRFFLDESGVDMRLGSRCVKIAGDNGAYELTLKDGSVFSSANLIVASGGSTYPSTGSDGTGMTLLKGLVDPKDIVGFKPALTSLTSRMQGIKALAGIRCKGSVMLSDGSANLDSSEGEIIFSKEGGISGICVMDISGKAVRLLDKGGKPVVYVDLIGRTVEQTVEMLELRRRKFGSRQIASALSGMMPRVLCEFVCRLSGIDPSDSMGQLSDKDISLFASNICAMKIPIDGYGGNDKAQVASGGVKLSAMNSDMQYRRRKGLYIIGEALNVDGRCGGYNLQWAWSSAAAAAKGVAENV
ncbi:MAG: aminoacetone oxidase family FAD-binding enzyme [Saccharofermentans sp.]|nr:aminoacetone oxidase family FAD-binding enzyme [Saccharofermentans sp.]